MRRHRAARDEHGGAIVWRLEYDSFIRVLVTLPHRDLEGYVDALTFPLLLDYSIDLSW